MVSQLLQSCSAADQTDSSSIPVPDALVLPTSTLTVSNSAPDTNKLATSTSVPDANLLPTSISFADKNTKVLPDSEPSITIVDFSETLVRPSPPPLRCSSPIIDSNVQVDHAQDCNDATINEQSIDSSLLLNTTNSAVNDSEYVPHEPSQNSASSEEEEFFEQSIPREKAYVVTKSQLCSLLKNIPCPYCLARSAKTELTGRGTAVKAKLVCGDCGQDVLEWCSQSLVGKLPIFNLLMSAAIVFAGSTYQTFEKCATFSGLQMVNRNTFFEIQRNLVAPAINTVYNGSIKVAREKLKKMVELLVMDDMIHRVKRQSIVHIQCSL